MSAQSQTGRKFAVLDFCAAMESVAPTGLAQNWDNVGLLAGDMAATVTSVLACIDLTPEVADEAIRERVDLILAYHPPIFKPVNALRADSQGVEAVVFRCIQAGIAIYATHTALDAARGGTNDVLALLCGVKDTTPLEYVDEPRASEFKLTVFVPPGEVEQVAEAMFNAGAGHIGDYSHCSYRVSGQGSFFGGESTHPTIGESGRMEYAEEMRLETIVPAKALPGVVDAMVRAHSYEEPAYDIYPLKARPVRGIGRMGALRRPTTLAKLARKLKRAARATCVQIVGPPERTVQRAVIVVGAAGSLPFRVKLTPNDVIVTGEIRHHDALTMTRVGCTAIALGHWASERPVLAPLVEQLQGTLTGISIRISEADAEPFGAV